ncbi:hypothetical protein [Plantactinospora soyae]|uniref:Transposase n=1 Tax=Plantactinospora soyae TaxID=1544732 RepID=A0A927M831_9ACTN|nr:hypothetical protein [Plantactinospora soyae]
MAPTARRHAELRLGHGIIVGQHGRNADAPSRHQRPANMKASQRGTHRSVRALNSDIRDWIGIWNDNPRPYAWTEAADRTLDFIKRYRAHQRLTTLVLQQEIRSELRGRCGFVRGRQAATVESQRLCGLLKTRR